MAGALLLPGCAASAAEKLPVADIEKIVHDYLLREPEVIYQAIQELQKRQQAEEAAKAQAMIAEHGDEIFRHADDPVVGNAEGDATLVEFFDYHCGYCRSMTPGLRAMIGTDPQLRFVFKDLPVLGPDSVTAAKAGVAAFKLDPAKYYDFHLALMQSKDLSRDAILGVAVKQGYDREKLSAEMDAALGQGAHRRQSGSGRAAGDQRHAQLRRRQDPGPGCGRCRSAGAAGAATSARR